MLRWRFFPNPGEPEEVHGIRADAELGEGLPAAGKGAGSQLPRSRHRRSVPCFPRDSGALPERNQLRIPNSFPEPLQAFLWNFSRSIPVVIWGFMARFPLFRGFWECGVPEG